MVFLLGGFSVALASSLLLTFYIRGWARRQGLVDAPDGARKGHETPTPNIGGVAIFLAAAGTLLLGVSVGVPSLVSSPSQASLMTAVGLGAVVIFALGLLDDIRHLRAWTKLGVEVAVAVALVFAGVRIEGFGLGGPLEVVIPFWLGVPVTVFWIVGITNSFNLLDGSDGVAGGAALFALLTMGAVSLLYGKDTAAVVCFVLAGATLGFLFFNFPPASIFMGDSGSLFLGFSLASLGVIATQKAPTILAVAVPLAAFGLPILDTSLAIVRRFLRRGEIFAPDRGHIHHRLSDLGHDPRSVALVLYMLAAALCLFSLLLAGAEGTLTAIAFLVVGTVLVLFVQRLRIPELLELGKLVNWGRMHRLVIERNMRVQEGAQRVRAARSPEALCSALRYAFGAGEFTRVELWIDDRHAGPLARSPEAVPMGSGVWFELVLEVDGHRPAGHPVELRFPLTLGGDASSQGGRLSLFRPVDGTRIHTDLTVVSRELVPGLESAVAGMSGSATDGAGNGEADGGAGPQVPVQGEVERRSVGD